MREIRRSVILLQRAWRIHINPPKESLDFVHPEEVQEVFEKKNSVKTYLEPKQISISENGLVFVSCMKGHSLDVFDINNNLDLVKRIGFMDQCVEVSVDDELGKAFVTTTNFSRNPSEERNRLNVVDLKTLEVSASVDTGGNWSKVVKIHPSKKYAFVSNWHSNDISVISIEDINNPKVVQILRPYRGLKQLESPRGIDFTPDGKIGLVTGFYSRNLLEIAHNKNGEFEFSFITDNLIEGEYGGNPRDIIINPDGKLAFYSNLGTNTIHAWSIKDRKIIATVKVGKEPNSISLMGKDGEILLVSCRASRSVYALDTKDLHIIGRSQQTGKTPTGLAVKDKNILVSDFDSAELELYVSKSRLD